MIEAAPEPSVVIVDDDVDHAVIARLVLAQVAPAADVTVMTDPRRLLERLVVLPAQALVLVDRNLDGRDGIALVAAVRAERSDLRLVVLSAALDDREQARAFIAGANDALEKPSDVASWRVLFVSLLGISSRNAVAHAA